MPNSAAEAPVKDGLIEARHERVLKSYLINDSGHLLLLLVPSYYK